MHSKLEADSIVKAFDDKVILSDVYISCQTGEIIGILGRNGSGKSTLLQILFGSLEADFKFIRVDSIVMKKPYEFKNTISYLPQHDFIPHSILVKTAIHTFLKKQKWDAFESDLVIGSILHKRMSLLSGGEKKYLQVKLILSSDAKFCLLDEPFNGISPILRDQISAMIIEKSAEKGVIITDHDYHNVMKIASSVCVMKDGAFHHLRNITEIENFGYLPNR